MQVSLCEQVGQTALRKASCAGGSTATVQALVGAGADANLQCKVSGRHTAQFLKVLAFVRFCARYTCYVVRAVVCQIMLLSFLGDVVPHKD
jgi:hypothetical protein